MGYHANNCDWCDYVLSWRDWYNRISTHAVTSLIWCGTCKFATFQGFVIKWIHNPARNPVSGYKIKWESTKYRSKIAVGTYELSIKNWTYGSDETYPKRVLQDFKKVPFFLKIAYFTPLNALRAHTAWSKKTTLLQRFLGHACLYTTLHLSGPPGTLLKSCIIIQQQTEPPSCGYSDITLTASIVSQSNNNLSSSALQVRLLSW